MVDNDQCQWLPLDKPEILMAVAKSGFLTEKDYARFFLCTAKAITNHASLEDGGEWVWKELCVLKWGAEDTETKLLHTGWTAKKFYRKFALKTLDTALA